MSAVSTTGDGEIEATEENAGDNEAMVVEEEKTAEDALPGGNDKISKIYLRPLLKNLL